ncbi:MULTISPECIES: hypothetical protein [Sphingomonas]|uniref:hypothetical protein n=1 Tax=Sphingomonas TaxID=13687 RepID=UPI0012698976|nr:MULTISPECIES: hypothetical protein [Sphingomonas]
MSLLTGISLYLYACVPVPLANLRAVHVQRLSAAALPAQDDLRETLVQRGEAVWKVTLAGSSDWINQIRRHELNGYAVVVPCDAPDIELFASGPYQGITKVSYYGRGFNALRSTAGDTTYDLYVPETGTFILRADVNKHMSDYDLGRERLNLCVSLAGGAMTGAYARSNEVRVEVGRAR